MMIPFSLMNAEHSSIQKPFDMRRAREAVESVDTVKATESWVDPKRKELM